MNDKIRRRPRISLRVPRAVIPGAPFTVVAVLDVKSSVDVESVELTLTGTMRAFSGGSESRGLCHVTTALCGARTLSVGGHELPCQLEIPAQSPPSYHTALAMTRYWIDVQVVIPWWPDANAEFELCVAQKTPVASYPGQSRLVMASGPSTPTSPHLEVSLGRDVFTPGEIARGQVSLANIGATRFRELTIRLRGLEEVTIRGGTGAANTRTDERYHMPLVAEEGKAFPFRIRLPESLPPSHDTELWCLRYELAISADGQWERPVTATVPITIVPHRFHDPGLEVGSLPSIGAARERTLWQTVATEHGLALVGDELRGDVDGVALVIGREHRGVGRPLLAADLSYAPLGIDLVIGGRDEARRDAGQPVVLGVTPWDRRHHVVGRDLRQSRDFLGVLRPLLVEFRRVSMTDDAARLIVPAKHPDASSLRLFVADAVALARAVTAGRTQIEPPTAMLAHVPAWARLAAELGGTFYRAQMVIIGANGPTRHEVRTEWTASGDPLRTVIRVIPRVTIESSWWLGAPTPLASEHVQHLPPDAHPLLQRIADGARFVSISHDGVSAHLDAPLPDVAGSRARLDAMKQLVWRLASPGGPYR